MTRPVRMVVITAESCCAGAAVHSLLEEYADQVALVVISHPEKAGALWQATLTHWRRSGLRFVWFLLLNFSIYRLWTWARAHARLVGRPQSLSRECARLDIEHYETKDVNDRPTTEAIRASVPDVIIVCYFEQILRDEAIALASLGVLNIHTALLPAHRGLFPEIWALAAGEKEIGVTIHEITDRRIDAGPIVAQASITVRDDWSALAASQAAHQCGVTLLDEALERLAVHEAVSGSGRRESYHSFPDRRTVRAVSPRRLARLGDLRAGHQP